ncbi:hypothetical protein DFJ63DRAFT_317016 [Scheffersomyces coipomensis]|uniref:uncharacterized protein n=1 Tax=Scheffersomyces coipomensis TaxID=1788519 RepID=UPI00315DD697
MSAFKAASTPLYKLYLRRVPDIAVWAGGMTFFLGWPHVWSAACNKIDDVPDINTSYLSL